MKILLTAESGVTVINFTDAYAKKHQLFVPDAEEADLTRYEAAESLFAGETYDAVIHIVQPGERDSDALAAFKNVQYAALRAGVKKMLTVTDATRYDPAHAASEEEDFAMPVYPRSLSEYLIESLAVKDGFGTVLRLYGVYGKGMAPESGIAQVLAPSLSGKKPVVIPDNTAFSAVYAEDVARILCKFCENDLPRGIYNVASPDPVTYADFAKKAKAYAKKELREIEIVKSDKAAGSRAIQTDKLTAALGAFKFTSLSAGVQKTLAYYGKHKSQLKSTKA